MDDANSQPRKKTAGVLRGSKGGRFNRPPNKPVDRSVTTRFTIPGQQLPLEVEMARVEYRIHATDDSVLLQRALHDIRGDIIQHFPRITEALVEVAQDADWFNIKNYTITVRDERT